MRFEESPFAVGFFALQHGRGIEEKETAVIEQLGAAGADKLRGAARTGVVRAVRMWVGDRYSVQDRDVVTGGLTACTVALSTSREKRDPEIGASCSRYMPSPDTRRPSNVRDVFDRVVCGRDMCWRSGRALDAKPGTAE